MASLTIDLTLKFQREINRICDSDRNTRKSGLKNLLEKLPWSCSDVEEVQSLRNTCKEALFAPLLLTLADQAEKCRELSIALLTKIVHLFQSDLEHENVIKLVNALCRRVNDTPFPEKSEEIRFQVIQLIRVLCPLVYRDGVVSNDVMILPAIAKALVDLFPDAKKACSEVIIEIGKLTPPEHIRMHYKELLRGLIVNATHQHYKVRSLAVKALSTVLCSLGSCITREKDVLGALQDQLLPLLPKLLADRSAGPRKATALLLGALIIKRVVVGSWLDPSSAAASSVLATASPSPLTPASSADLLTPTPVSAPPPPPTSVSASHDLVELDPDVSSHKAAALDTVLLSTLVLTLGDADDTVRAAGKKYLKKISAVWSVQCELKRMKKKEKKEEGSEESFVPFVRAFSPFALHNISGGVLHCWTTESKARQIRGLTALIEAVRDLCEFTGEQDTLGDGDRMDVDVDVDVEETECERNRHRVTAELLTGRLLPQTLDALASTARDECIEIRSAAEACCSSIGSTLAAAAVECNIGADCEGVAYTGGVDTVLAYLVPRVQGVLAGLDTAPHRTSALTLLTYIVQGIGLVDSTPQTEKTLLLIADLCVRELSGCMADPCLYEFRETSLRESALLLSRVLYKVSSNFTAVCRENLHYQCCLFQSFVYLCGRCAYEDVAIPRAARRELKQFAEAMEGRNPYPTPEEKLQNALSTHFATIVQTITNATNTNASGSDGGAVSVTRKPCVTWTADSAHRAAFEALVRECPRAAWQEHATVVSEVLVPLVQPPASLVKGTPEEIASTYAAQRGDLSMESGEGDGAVDTRLGMLALLETLLRNGSTDWECGKHISACCDVLVEKALIPNLVWRAGRVEGVARKVTLTAAFGLLKAGAIGPQSLYRHAPRLVPLLASELEDQDASARHLGCLCLGIIFERLKGGFGEQAVQDIYPRLLKRLDDSDDTIRVAVCDTLMTFLLCAPKEAYQGTMLTYTLDQLFIHLDDPDPKIQKCVFDVLVHIAEHLDRALVLKKASANIQSHRTPVMCEAVIHSVNKLT